MSESPAAVAIATVNGDATSLEGVATIGDLLRRLGIRPERVVVELNGTIHRRNEGLDTPVAAGDIIEIVQFVGGG